MNNTLQTENQLLKRDIESLRTINYDLYSEVKHLENENGTLKFTIEECKKEFGDKLIDFLETLDTDEE